MPVVWNNRTLAASESLPGCNTPVEPAETDLEWVCHTVRYPQRSFRVLPLCRGDTHSSAPRCPVARLAPDLYKWPCRGQTRRSDLSAIDLPDRSPRSIPNRRKSVVG